MEKIHLEDAMKELCAVETVSLDNASYLALTTADGVPVGHISKNALII